MFTSCRICLRVLTACRSPRLGSRRSSTRHSLNVQDALSINSPFRWVRPTSIGPWRGCAAGEPGERHCKHSSRSSVCGKSANEWAKLQTLIELTPGLFSPPATVDPTTGSSASTAAAPRRTIGRRWSQRQYRHECFIWGKRRWRGSRFFHALGVPTAWSRWTRCRSFVYRHRRMPRNMDALRVDRFRL